jgi:hypothetical protein
MPLNFYEAERPTEWLLQLREAGDHSSRLLKESGSLAQAAYRLARARCRVSSPLASAIPTLRELRVAAHDLLSSAAVTTGTPDPWELARECEESGLPVITPIPAPVAT